MCRIYLPTMADVCPSATYDVFLIDGRPTGPEAASISCQWRCQSISDLRTIRQYDTSLCSQMTEAKGEACVSFSTMMRRLDF